MNLLLAYYSRAAVHQAQGGGITVHWSIAAIVALCVWSLIREYRHHTAPKRAAKQRLREECEVFGHTWGEAYLAMGEYNRDCRHCGKQQHTTAGIWPGEA